MTMLRHDEHTLTKDEIIEYLRKSRSDDALLTVEEVLAKHEAILDEWAENNIGEKIAEENKFREVVSGETIDDRPEIKKVLSMIESPKIKAILVVEVQRLSRGDLEDAGRLIKLLRYTNTLVITPQKTYDLRDEYDRDFFERELKRGNEFLEYQKKIMNRGRLLSVQQGNYLGSIPPYGYDKAVVMDGKRKCPTLAINEEEANVVRMIFDMYVNDDMGRTNICHRLDKMGIKPAKGKYWSPAFLKTMLENVHYIGQVKWNWRKSVTIVEDGEITTIRPQAKIGEYLIYEGKHQAIISTELFNAAQEKQGRNPRAKKEVKIRNPLAGLVYCKCGRAMSYRTYKDTEGKERNAPRLLCDGQTHCKTGSCLYSEMETLVCNILGQCIEDFEMRINNNNADSLKMHGNLIKSLEKKMESLEALEISQWEKYSKEGMPKNIFDTLNEKVLRDKEEVRQALCHARETMPNPVDYEEKLQRFQDALDALKDDSVDPQRKNTLLKACIDRIEYTRAKPERLKRKPGEKKGESLKRGGQWTNPEIELDVKLRV